MVNRVSKIACKLAESITAIKANFESGYLILIRAQNFLSNLERCPQKLIRRSTSQMAFPKSLLQSSASGSLKRRYTIH